MKGMSVLPELISELHDLNQSLFKPMVLDQPKFFGEQWFRLIHDSPLKLDTKG